MNKEWLDVVDKKNRLTGKTVNRQVAHAKGIWHRVVHIYLYRMWGDEIFFLVHRRSKNKELMPDRWARGFGGHVMAGETVEEAVLAEIYEEIGLKVELKHLVKGPVIEWVTFPNNEFSYLYFLEVGEDVSGLRFRDNEVQAVKWMTENELIDSADHESGIWASSYEMFKPVVVEFKKLICK